MRATIQRSILCTCVFLAMALIVVCSKPDKRMKENGITRFSIVEEIHAPQSLIDGKRPEGVWFACTRLNVQEDGETVRVITVHTLPGPVVFAGQTEALLKTIAGKPPLAAGSTDYSRARVIVMPEEVQRMGPQEGIRELFGR